MSRFPLRMAALAVLAALSAPALWANPGPSPPATTSRAAPATKSRAVLLYEQGMTYADSRDYGRAVETFQDAIALNDDYAEAHNMLGFSLRQMGEYARAVDSYKRALALRPGYAEAHEYIGEAYLALDDLLHAMQHYLVLQRQRSTEAPELWAKIRTYVETRTRA